MLPKSLLTPIILFFSSTLTGQFFQYDVAANIGAAFPSCTQRQGKVALEAALSHKVGSWRFGLEVGTGGNLIPLGTGEFNEEGNRQFRASTVNWLSLFSVISKRLNEGRTKYWLGLGAGSVRYWHNLHALGRKRAVIWNVGLKPHFAIEYGRVHFILQHLYAGSTPHFRGFDANQINHVIADAKKINIFLLGVKIILQRNPNDS